MTPDECDDFKKEILREIETHKINIYEFPDHDDEEENRFVPSWEPNQWPKDPNWPEIIIVLENYNSHSD